MDFSSVQSQTESLTMPDPVTATTTTPNAPTVAVDPIKIPTPASTGLAAIKDHLFNWAELYGWVPLSLLGIILFAKFSTFLLGRKPLDQGYDFVGLGFKLSICVFLILLLSITRQATGVWVTKAKQVMHIKHLIWAQRAKTVAMAIIFTYIIMK